MQITWSFYDTHTLLSHTRQQMYRVGIRRSALPVSVENRKKPVQALVRTGFHQTPEV